MSVVEDSTEEGDETASIQLKVEKEAAVAAMWAWYQDWAKTARTVVKNKNYQVMLGLMEHGVVGTGVTDAGLDALDADTDYNAAEPAAVGK